MKCMMIMLLTIYLQAVSAQTTTYEYDKLYRLTKITYDNGSTITYQYDANGNRLFQHNIGGTIDYEFIGNGLWSDSTNWRNNRIPPVELPAGARIIVNPIAGGECILDTPQKILTRGVFRLMPGKKMTVGRDFYIYNE